MSLFGELEGRRSRIEQVRENSSRPGRSWAYYKTAGAGVYVEPKVFKFDSAFIDMPIFTYGGTLDPDGPPLDPSNVPGCEALCYDWQQNGHGFYVGAFVVFTVNAFSPDPNEDPDEALRCIFTLAWEGVACKDFIASSGFPVNDLDI